MSYDQTDQDQLYIEDGYFTPDGYYVYIAEARVDLTPYIDEGYIDFNYYEYYGGFASLTAELTEVVGQLKEAEAQLSSTVSTSVSAQRTRNADSAVDCAFTQTATVTRIQQGASAVSAQASQTTQAVKTVSADINAGALFSPSITVEAVKNMTAVIDCVATISADTQATKVFNITLSTVVTQSLQGVYTADAQSSIASDFNITATTDVVKEYSSNQSSEFTQTVSIDKLKRASASLSSAASLSAQALNLGDRPLQLETAGTTSFDTAQKKFGTHSLQQTGSQPISYYAGYDQLPQTSNFYISGWYRPDTGAINQSGIRYLAFIINTLRIDLLGDDTVRLSIIDTAGNLQVVGTSTAISANNWYHIAVSRKGQGLALWLNGTRAAYVNNFFDVFSFNNSTIQPLVRFAQTTGHYDEWEMQKDTFGIYDTANTTYTVPTTETANNETNTRFLFHWDNSYADDISKQGAATLSAQASQTSVITKTVGASANLTSAVTQTATATKAVQAQINLNAAFSQSVSAEDIDLAEIALSAEFTLQAQVDDLDLAAASLTSEFTFTVSTDKLKGAVIDVGAMFTPVIDCVATRVGDIDLTATAQLSATANYTVNFASAQTAQSTVSATPKVILNSQVFVNILRPETDYISYGAGTATDSERNVYSLGIVRTGTALEGTRYVVVAKFDPQGNFEWYKVVNTFNGTEERARISIANDEIYISYGETRNTWTTYLQKLDLNGNNVWAKQVNGFAITNFVLDSTYIYAVANYNGLNDQSILKINQSDGSVSWQKTYTNSTFSQIPFDATDIVVANTSVYVSYSYGFPSRVYKFSATNGAFQKAIRFNNATYLESITADSAGNIIAIPYYGLQDNVLMKLDSNLDIVWQKSYDIDTRIPGFVITDSNNNIYIGGPNQSSETNDGILTSFDSSGNFRWYGILTNTTNAIDFNSTSTHTAFINTAFSHIDSKQNWGVAQYNQLGAPEFHINLQTPFTSTLDWDIDSITVSTANKTISSISELNTSFNSIIFSNATPSTPTLTLTSYPVYVTKEFSSVQTSQTTVNAAGIRIRTGASAQTVTSTMTVTGTRLARADSTQASAFTQTAAGDATKPFASAQSSSFAVSSTIKRTRTVDSAISAQASVSAEPYDFTKADAQLTTTATISAEISKFAGSQAQLSTTATLAIAYTRIRPADIQTDSIATQLTAAFRNATGTVLLESNFAQQAQAVKTTDIVKEFNAVSSILAQAQTTVFAEANISAEATQTIQATKFRPAQANLSSNFTINISAVKTTNVISNNSAEFTQTTVNGRLRDFNTTLNAETAQNTQGLRVKIFTVNVNTSASILATAFALVKFEAGLTSNGFVVTVGDVEHIDPYYTYMIEQETRAFQIDEEPRLSTIDPETRVNIIKGSTL